MSSRLSVMSELDFPVPGVLVLGRTPNLGVTLLLLPGVAEGVLDGVGVCPGLLSDEGDGV